MATVVPPLTFSRGETWTLSVALLEADSVTPVDLTGAAMDWVIAKDLISDPLLTASLGSGITLIGSPTLGTVLIQVNPTGNSMIMAGDYIHQARVVKADSTTIIPFGGSLTVINSPFAN